MGSRKNIPNKRNQDLYMLADKLGIDILLIKLLLAGGRLKELGYTEEQIKTFRPQELVDIQTKNTSDLLPYWIGKRTPIDSEGNDSHDPISELVNAFRSK